MSVPRRFPRFLMAALVLSLPLLLSQCSRKQQPLVRGLTPEEAAKMAEASGQWDTSRSTKWLQPPTLPPERLEALGESALQSRNFEKSLINFLPILAQNPERYDLRYKVGVIFLLTGQYEAARRELAMVLVHRPEMLQAHEALALVHLQEKQYPLAIQEFQLVLSQDPRRVQTRYLLGATYLEGGQPEKAAVQLKEAANLDPRQVSTYIALGQAYHQMKNYPQAVAYLKQGQALAPQNQKVNYHLGMALAAQKKYPEALEAFLKAGDEAQAYNNVGVYYFGDGQYEEAAKCFQRALDLRPTFYQEAKNNLQRALEKLRQSRQNDG